MSLAVIQADCKRALGQLSHLSNDELDVIINNDEKIEEILQNLDQNYLKDIEAEKENLLASNNSLAEFNLSREPELVERREKVIQLSERGEELSKTVEEKSKTLREQSGDMSLETTLALLQTAASEMEEESDSLSSKFLDGELELDEFLEQFLSRRRTVHMRLVKAEKMAKILSRNPNPGGPNYVNAPPVAINSNYYPGANVVSPPIPNIPYPMGPIGMPMPGNANYFQNHY